MATPLCLKIPLCVRSRENSNRFHNDSNNGASPNTSNLSLSAFRWAMNAKPAEDTATDDPLQIIPRFAQLDALEALESTYAEGYARAMVVIATGLGKTYLAGFFAQRFNRVLFIVHREEILQQAFSENPKLS